LTIEGSTAYFMLSSKVDTAFFLFRRDQAQLSQLDSVTWFYPKLLSVYTYCKESTGFTPI